jgi:LytR cell envelope-related transcriptional attenuator
MSSDQPRRSRDTGSAGSPMGSTAAIVIAIVAVVAGFLILRQINDDDDGGVATTVTTAPISSLPATLATNAPVVTLPVETTPTTAAPVVEGATAVVANASTVNGAAGVLTTALTGEGFTMGPATNATAKQEVSTILYDASNPQALPVATYMASLMGNIAVQEVTTPAPIDGGLMPEGVTIIVMLGSDKANSTLEQMSAPTTTVPAVAGATTGTTVAG